MKVTLIKNNYQNYLKFFTNYIPSKPQIPVLSGIHVSLEDFGCILRSTDLYSGIKVVIPAKIETKGSFVVPGKQFIELLLSISSDEVELEANETQLTISFQNNKAKLNLLKKEDFPELLEYIGSTFEIDEANLSQIHKKVVFSSSQDQTRPVLTSVFFEKEDDSAQEQSISNKVKAVTTESNKVKVVATDGFRLSVLEIFSEKFVSIKESFLMQSKNIAEALKVMDVAKSSSIKITPDFDQRIIVFSCDQVEFFSRMIDGEFPPYQKIIPEKNQLVFSCDVVDLLDHIKRAQVISRDNSNIIKLKVVEGSLEVISQSNQLGGYSGVIELSQSNNNDIEIAFNSKYILEFLQNIKNGEINFFAFDSHKPTRWEVDNEENYTHVIMPFRLH